MSNVLAKNSQWILTIDRDHWWTLGTLTSSLPAALVLVIVGLDKATLAIDFFFTRFQVLRILDTWGWESWGMFYPSWDARLKETDVWLTLEWIGGIVSEVFTFIAGTKWYDFIVPLASLDTVDQYITTVVLVSAVDCLSAVRTGTWIWAYVADALVLVAQCSTSLSVFIFTDTRSVKFGNKLLVATALNWKMSWTITLAFAILTSPVNTSTGVDRGMFDTESLGGAIYWFIWAWNNITIRVRFSFVIAEALAEFALSTWIDIPFLSNSVLGILPDTLVFAIITDTRRVGVAVIVDVINADIKVTVIWAARFDKTEVGTAGSRGGITISELTAATTELGSIIIDVLPSTGSDNIIALIETVIDQGQLTSSDLSVDFTIVDAWFGLAFRVSLTAWTMWVSVDLVRFSWLTHWWFFETEFFSAYTSLFFTASVTPGICSVSVVGMGDIGLLRLETSMSADLSITVYWRLWHWSWVSVLALALVILALPLIAAIADTVIDQTVTLLNEHSFATTTSWLLLANVSRIGTGNAAVVTAAAGLATVTDNWVGRDDLIPELV